MKSFENNKKELDFYRNFFKKMNASLYMLNHDPYGVDWITDNECVRKVTGLTAMELTQDGQNIAEQLLHNPDYVESVTLALAEFSKDPDRNWIGVYRILDQDNIQRWVLYSVTTATKNQDGLPEKYSVAALPLGDIINTPLTLSKFQTYIGDVIHKKTIDSLTVRQSQILKLLAQGNSRKEIAAKLRISIYTVDDHKKALMNKLNIKKTSELIKKAIQFNLE